MQCTMLIFTAETAVDISATHSHVINTKFDLTSKQFKSLKTTMSIITNMERSLFAKLTLPYRTNSGGSALEGVDSRARPQLKM